MIEKSSGILIKDKKILLVSGNGKPFYWTPGGKLESGESPEIALEREIKEELNASVVSMSPYHIYISDNEEDGKARKVHCFIIEISIDPECSGEIEEIVWVSKEDIEKGRIKLQMGVIDHLIPKLLEDKLI